MKRLHSFLFLIFYFLQTINLIKKGLALKLVIPFLLITFSMFSFQCKKSNPNSDNGLPPATQTGQGVFACRVNGEPWISKRGRPDMGGSLSKDTLIAKGTTTLKNGDIETFVIYLRGTFNLNQKEYLLNDTTNSYILYLRVNSGDCFQNNAGYGAVIKKFDTGKLMVTKADSISKIIAGTFSFQIPTDYCDTLKVTDGRFDIKYQ